MRSAFFVFLLLSNVAMADTDWVCGEAASLRRDNTILACGVGQGKSLSEARDNALEAAKREFESVCDQSVDCKNHEVLVTPKRNSCEEKSGVTTCYRAVYYEISEQQKVKIELANVYEPEKKVVDQNSLKWRLQFGIGYSGAAMAGLNVAPDYVCCGAFDISLRRALFWRISLGVRYSYRGGGASLPSQKGNAGEGAPNSYTNFVTSTSEDEFALSLPVRVTEGWFLIPEYGILSADVTNTTRSYNALGQGSWTGKNTTQNIQKRFFGAQAKYESGFFELSKVNLGMYFSTGYRQYYDDAGNKNGTLNVGVGLQFGF